MTTGNEVWPLDKLLETYAESVRTLIDKATDPTTKDVDPTREKILSHMLKCHVRQISLMRAAYGENMLECTCDDVWPCFAC